jgi:hypothetical protein
VSGSGPDREQTFFAGDSMDWIAYQLRARLWLLGAACYIVGLACHYYLLLYEPPQSRVENWNQFELRMAWFGLGSLITLANGVLLEWQPKSGSRGLAYLALYIIGLLAGIAVSMNALVDD